MNTLILDALSNFRQLPTFGENKFNSIEIINNIENDNETFERIILLQNGNIDNVPTRFKNVLVSDTSAENVLNVMIKEAKNSDNVVVVNATNPFFDKEFIIILIAYITLQMCFPSPFQARFPLCRQALFLL